MKMLCAVITLSVVTPVHAGIVIYGTRVIYPAEKSEITLQLMNQEQNASLVQAWIDDGNTSLPPEKIQVPFLLTPPVVRVPGNSGQQLKIKKMPNTLPKNKESLFYLNVLDIPPNNPANAGKNVIKFAMQNRIKLFYRPSGIAPVNSATFKKIVLVRNGKTFVIKNDNANWVTVAEIKVGSVKINDKSVMVAPFSSEPVMVKSSNANQYKLTIINDYGSFISDSVSLK
ncbi:fimbria/pilus periplasmic chaperone [Citrobacter freundii]|uniref:Fimbria/pilus periplasmic chaperone n=2 Tax=Citrobacter TaxID=544 RepID=A0AAW7LRA5_9ENTR|nr:MULTISPECIES: fimbria/pilus periplasmic chaperone [Citrobacter]MBJ8795306.1 fimbria/pilus periplasmic chaperone [Citrobacter freundii]MBJ9339833.1 fimbria/pilus periplasmic chaperone [Citrobacter freundii]MCS1418940.1 fimbria/pilus periplasmic chaperone [Citrobacter portucalensis]MCX8990711.1 fimbria/pilus periplasmic chaperone [Citrobacter portucalensis]MCX9039732.1 fimbria/pilus periplasmic chaperone [Citrobacter portucalensis]